MKRILLSLVLLFIVSVINAQVKIEKVATIFSNDFDIIPSYLCKGEKTILVAFNKEKLDDEFSYYNCYDSSLNIIHQFRIKKNIVNFRFIDFDINPGLFLDIVSNCAHLNFTQTLFNDDEKFEYFASIQSDPENPNSWDLYICNEDGHLLQKLDIGARTNYIYIIKINSDYYILKSHDGFEFYKINKSVEPTGTKEINITKTQKAPTRFFDLTGKTVNPDAAKGKVIIKTDGTTSEKVLMK